MTTLSRELRKQLENTVRKARRAAEEGALKAIEQLAVHESDSYASLTTAQRALRKALRAHGKQLGDKRFANGTQETAHLTSECAYEQWHRLLFARFLAENDLLIEPESGVAISVDDCRELAAARGVDWRTLAGEFAVRMLPQIFRQGDPVLDVVLPPENRQELEDLLDALPSAVFSANDSLGWTYQFWQADLKDAVNESGVKIGADELAPVTQLFTEDYMVLFLLHNTLGAWWTAKRAAVGKGHELAGYEWTYLRFKDDGTPAAGAYDGWPREAKDITVLDPCMGSGHFLVFALPILVAFRVEEDGLSRAAAVQAVLRDNLYGLELDARCTQIAAFNLALAAWKMVGYCQLPPLNLACSGLGINARKEEWLALADDDQTLLNGMARLYELFKQSPVLGSLINPHTLGTDIAREQSEAFEAPFKDLKPMLDQALARESEDEEKTELAVTARGIARAAEILATKFTLVATNVPYLGRGKQDDALREYCEQVHPTAKADLATCFIQRGVFFCLTGGTAAVVSPQSWLFQDTYKSLRQHLLASTTWNIIGRLGTGAFETISGEVVNVVVLAISRTSPLGTASIGAIDVATSQPLDNKARALQSVPARLLRQSEILESSSAMISWGEDGSRSSLRLVASCVQGLSTGDNLRFVLRFWELSSSNASWRYFLTPSDKTLLYAGRDSLLSSYVVTPDYEAGAIRGAAAWNRRGVAIARIGSLAATLYDGSLFANTAPVIVPLDDATLPAIWAFASSGEFVRQIRSFNQGLSVDNGYIEKVPFDLDHWRRIAAEKYPNGLPTPYSSDPTQWLFNGHPRGSDDPLHVAVARLVGYRWLRQTGSSFPDCPALGTDGLEPHADADGIAPLIPLRGEASASDRLRAILADAYDAEWSSARERELLAATGAKSATIEDWLREEFFSQHSALFQQRPFVWHIWDGRPDGFHAFVNYHQLAAPNGGGRRTMEALTFTYLGDWIERQRADVAANVAGADGRLAAATHLQDELQRILAGEPPYDIFVRWKPLAQQAIGWEPDINDGVRINIRPFIAATPYKARGSNASILRATPRIKWEKDRGKEPDRDKADFPWFWSWDEATEDFIGGGQFDGNRWNDLHYSSAVKEAARARAARTVRNAAR